MPPPRRGRGSRSSGPSRGLASRVSQSHPQSKANTTSLVHLTISGFSDSKAAGNSDGGMSALTAWLERKARGMHEKSTHAGIQKRTTVRIRKFRLDNNGKILHIYVSPEQVSLFTKLDGFTFATSQISVRTLGTSGRDNVRQSPPITSSGKPNFSFKSRDNDLLVTTLKNLLGRRYNVDNKILNLSAILEEPEVKEVLAKPNNTLSKLFAALAALCEEAFPSKEARAEGVTGIQLADNKFQSLVPARAMAWEFPELLNLDITNNNIQAIEGVNHFRKCTKLQHILIAGNPWTQQPDFKSQLLRAFPSLKMVDGIEITDADRAEIKPFTTPTIAPGLYEDASGMGQKFLQNFFVGFDSDRKALVDYYYDNNSTFSYTVNTRAVMDPKSKNNMTKGEWEAWIYNSRDLMRITQPATRKGRLYKGPSNILGALEALPKTQHPSFDDMSKWLVESFPMQGIKDPSGASSTGVNGLCIVVHGELIENGDNAVKRKHRSFDRTFILGPGGNNPDGVGIISDLLSVRGYGGSKAFQPETNTTLSPEDEKAAMVAEVQRRTNMTPQYAQMCLEQTSWNVEAALESFQQVRANIPPDGFMS